MRSKNLSLYDLLAGCFISEGHNPLDVTPADLEKLPEEEKLRLSIAENLKLVLQTRCGAVLHLRDAEELKPDFGMPDFWEIYANYRNKNEALIQSFKNRLQKTILKYEPRISKVEFAKEEFDANNMRIALRIVATIKDADRQATLRTEFSTSGWTAIELERESL